VIERVPMVKSLLLRLAERNFIILTQSVIPPAMTLSPSVTDFPMLRPSALARQRPCHTFVEWGEEPGSVRVFQSTDAAAILLAAKRSRTPALLALAVEGEATPAVERLVGMLRSANVPARVLIGRGIADIERAARHAARADGIRIILGDLEPVAPLLCAYALEDAAQPALSGTLRCISSHFGITAGRVFGATLGSGFRIATVAAVAEELAEDRRTLLRQLSPRVAASPEEVIAAGRAATAMMMALRHGTPRAQAAHALRMKSPAEMDRLLVRAVDQNYRELLDEADPLRTEVVEMRILAGLERFLKQRG